MALSLFASAAQRVAAPQPRSSRRSAAVSARPSRPAQSRVVAARAEPAGDSTYSPVWYDPATSTSWHFVIANADFMLNDENSEHLPEVMRERRRFFLENQAKVNFFIVPNPAWLDSMPEVAKRVRQPAVALVSPDEAWIQYVPAATRTRTRTRGWPACGRARRGPVSTISA